MEWAIILSLFHIFLFLFVLLKSKDYGGVENTWFFGTIVFKEHVVGIAAPLIPWSY